MTIFQLVRDEVTARDAAELYNLKFGRNGRAVCPWHNDHHPDLKFYDGGTCYCFRCHNGGDATALTAQIFGLPQKDAAEQLRRDFHLDTPVSRRPDPATKARRQQRRDAQEQTRRRWVFLCEVVQEADAVLARYSPDTIDSRFDAVLAARCRANEELDVLWEVGNGDTA